MDKSYAGDNRLLVISSRAPIDGFVWHLDVDSACAGFTNIYMYTSYNVPNHSTSSNPTSRLYSMNLLICGTMTLFIYSQHLWTSLRIVCRFKPDPVTTDVLVLFCYCCCVLPSFVETFVFISPPLGVV